MSILCLFGSSGSGKTKWRNYFVSNGFLTVKSLTTRKKRSAEDNEYEFVTKREFKRLHNNEELMNVNLNYLGEMYGIRQQDFQNDKNYVLISDMTSLKELTTYFKNICFVLCKGNFEDIKKRLTERGSIDRIETAKKEIEMLETIKYDYVLENENDAKHIIQNIIIK